MSDNQAKGSVAPTVRLVILIVVGIVIGNVVVTLLMNRDTGLGFDELIAFGGGALLGVLLEFGIFRRAGR
ncbi:hypothetical protein GCM10022224_080830 [Nonomuraea antimicrobica]|uniref:Uncharacterized protein n=1 Tax=Nonomuraea antimicrobica TaxID=561173 RepID=A0ABP7D9W9_9ACTN